MIISTESFARYGRGDMLLTRHNLVTIAGADASQHEAKKPSALALGECLGAIAVPAPVESPRWRRLRPVIGRKRLRRRRNRTPDDDIKLAALRAAGIAADVVAAWHGHTERMTQAVRGVTDDRLTAASAVFSASAVGQI
jgi:hypothetical protein